MQRQTIHNFGVRGQPQRGALRFYNASDASIPPYYPLLLFPEGVDGNPFDPGDGTILDSPVLSVAAVNGFSGLPFVNNNQQVEPHSYGTGTLTHPMPLAVDPNSFPIWNGSYANPPTLGSAQDYLASGQGATFPPLGFGPYTGNGWVPATFSPNVPSWQALCWDKNADGTLADDRVLAVPWVVRDFPYAGASQIAFNGPVGAVETQVVPPVTVLGGGLYQVLLNCTVYIDVPGVAVTLTINYTPGPNSPSFVNGFGAITAAPWGSVYRQSPKFTVGGGGSGGSDDDTVSYATLGAEVVSLSTVGFGFQGDVWTLVASASEDCNPQMIGTMAYNRIGSATQNNASAAWTGGGWYGPGWNGWFGGAFGWGWGWGFGQGGLSASWW